MTSAAALELGFDAILRTNGETLTLLRAGGGVACLGLVDRNPRPTKDRTPDFNPNHSSMIEVKKSAFVTIPKKSEAFLDRHGVRHRISEVTPRDFTLACECVKGWET
jgi:hypothetical protein